MAMYNSLTNDQNNVLMFVTFELIVFEYVEVLLFQYLFIFPLPRPLFNPFPYSMNVSDIFFPLIRTSQQ